MEYCYSYIQTLGKQAVRFLFYLGETMAMRSSAANQIELHCFM